MSQPPSFTQAQVRRAVKGAESAGLRVVGVTVRPDGSIRVETGEKKEFEVELEREVVL